MIDKDIFINDLEYIGNNFSFKENFENSTIVLTGCGGFLGFYFLNYFLKYSKTLRIKKIIGLDSCLLGKRPWIFNLSKTYSDVFDFINFDIVSDQLTDIPEVKNANYVIHMASIASPTFYRRYPLQTIDSNIIGLRRLLDVYKESKKLKGFLFFSSSEIYGDPTSDEIPTNEEYRGNVSCHGPRACYDEAKRLGETICNIYGKSFGLPVVVARPFNNFGPGMDINDKRLPADFANSILNQNDIEILSNGLPTRTFCYISDAIVGYIKCLLHGKYDYFNIGTDGPETSVINFAKIFLNVGKKHHNYQGKILYRRSDEEDYMTDNPNRRCPDISKARKVLGFKPKIDLNEGVRRYLYFLSEKK